MPRSNIVLLFIALVMASGCLHIPTSVEPDMTNRPKYTDTGEIKPLYLNYKTYYETISIAEVVPKEYEVERNIKGNFTSERTFGTSWIVINNPNVTDGYSRRYVSESGDIEDLKALSSRILTFKSNKAADYYLEDIKSGFKNRSGEIKNIEGEKGFRYRSTSSTVTSSYVHHENYVYSISFLGFSRIEQSSMDSLEELMREDITKEPLLKISSGLSKQGNYSTSEIALRLSNMPTYNGSYYTPYNLTQWTDSASNSSEVVERTYRSFSILEKKNVTGFPDRITSSATEYRSEAAARSSKERFLDKIRDQGGEIESVEIVSGINATRIEVKGERGKNTVLYRRKDNLIYFIATGSDDKYYPKLAEKLFIKMLADVER